MDAKHHCLFCSAETDVLGIQRFCKTHFMLIVYLIRNSNCLWGLINLWKRNRSIVYPHVILFVHIYEIFMTRQSGNFTVIWICLVSSFLTLPPSIILTGNLKQLKRPIPKFKTSQRVHPTWGKKQCILQLSYTLCYAADYEDLSFFKQTELAALVGDFLLYWMNPCLVPTSTKHVFF